MKMSNLRNAAFLFLFLFAHAQNTTSLSVPKSPCLSRFFTERAHFKPCLTQVCFLFLNQIPFVILDSTMTREKDQALFPCKNRRKLFSKLGGISFQIHQEIEFESLCVWGGTNCSFNEMTKFVADRAKDPSTNQYQFGVQGMVAQLPTRLTLGIRTTITLVEDPIVFLKGIKGYGPGKQTSLTSVFQGFEFGSWMALGSFIFIIFITATLVSFAFTGRIWPMAILLTLTTEPIIRDNSRSANATYRMHRSVVSLLGMAISAFLIITILFYEMSIVNFIFNDVKEKLPKPLHEFSDQELALFGARPNTSPENMLVKGTDPTGTRFQNKVYPWHRCPTWDTCYRKLLDPNDPVIYMPVFEPEGLYEIKIRQACGKLVVLEGGGKGTPHGWYLSTAVPKSVFNKVNYELLRLTLTSSLENIMHRTTGKDEKFCGSTKLSISPLELMIPLSLLVGPVLLTIFGLLIRSCLLGRDERKEFSMTDPELPVPNNYFP